MKKLQSNSVVGDPSKPVTLMRGITWGCMAGLAGTIAMDLVMAGGLSAMGFPADTCYKTIGSTVTHFFDLFGLHLAGEFTLGATAYHIIGPLLGAFYGLIVSQVGTLQRATLKKALLFAVLYAEIVSQLILTLVPVLLRIPANEAIVWFAGSSVLHGIWGIVMGFAAHYGLRMGMRKNRNSNKGTGEISWTLK